MKKTSPPGLRSEVGRYESAHDSSEPKFSRVLYKDLYPTNPEKRPDHFRSFGLPTIPTSLLSRMHMPYLRPI